MKSYDKLTFLQVEGAGHMVPKDQPKAALDMLKSFLNNQPFDKLTFLMRLFFIIVFSQSSVTLHVSSCISIKLCIRTAAVLLHRQTPY